jgi:hypothetical protein
VLNKGYHFVSSPSKAYDHTLNGPENFCVKELSLINQLSIPEKPFLACQGLREEETHRKPMEKCNSFKKRDADNI